MNPRPPSARRSGGFPAGGSKDTDEIRRSALGEYMQIYKIIGLVGFFLLAACSSDDEEKKNEGANTPIAAAPLSGTVAGQPWTVTVVEAESLPEETEFSATAYAESVTACQSTGFGNKPSLVLAIPKAPGDYPLGFDTLLFGTFFNPANNDNLVATNGHIVVESVTATQITGGAAITYDAANTVNGKFTATICP